MGWNHQEKEKLEMIHALKHCGGFAGYGGSNAMCFLCRGLGTVSQFAPTMAGGGLKLHTLGTPKGSSPLALVQLLQMC